LEIIALMLDTIKEKGKGRFSIMRHVGTNSMQLKKYLDALIQIGFVEVSIKKGHVLYKASEKGRSFLTQYYILQEMLINAYLKQNNQPNALDFWSKNRTNVL